MRDRASVIDNASSMFRRSAQAIALYALLAVAPVRADEIRRPPSTHTDEWSDIGPGLRYLHRTTSTPASIHALIVDLSVPGVRIRATPYKERWQTVTEYATHTHVAAATNGGFWGMFQRAQGVTAGNGERWPDGHDDNEVGFLGITRTGRAWISLPEVIDDEVAKDRISEAVSGEPLVVRNGNVDSDSLNAFEGSNQRHPRTAAGVSRDGTKVILIVADGRQGASRGLTLYELSRMFVELGAWTALNLDGGGSSAMFVEKKGGIVNTPSGGRWEAKLGFGAGDDPAKPTKQRTRTGDGGVEEVFVRGNEREVMNHIGIIIPDKPIAANTANAVPEDDETDDEPVAASNPKEPFFAFGRSREVLYPIFYTLAVLTPIISGIAFFLLRKHRKNRG